MAIVRSGSRVSKASTHASSSTDGGLPVRHRQRSAGRTPSVADSEASGDSDLAEKRVEICQVGEEICAVPYDLFELSDLKGILSLDTWNFCLTEEERENLCAYLPNIDEESYRKTLRGLFAGENFDFGSPMTQLFDRLKGGLCHPQVVRYREGFKYLQRKEHYHHLRNYHNNMVNTFLEMQNVWQNFPRPDYEERIELWKSCKADKSKPLPPHSEKKTSLRKRRAPGLSERKAKLLKPKELSESPSPYRSPDRGASSRTERKNVLKLKLASRSKGGGDGSLKKLNGNETEKPKRSKSKGKMVTKGSLKSILNNEVGQSEPGPFFEQNNTTGLALGAFTLENEIPVRKKQAPRKKSEKKVVALGAGRKRKRMKQVCKLEEEKRKEETTANPEGTYGDGPMVTEENMLTDTKVDDEMQGVDEQKQEKPLAFQENHKDGQPEKKNRRRTKAREKIVNDHGQGVIPAKLEQDVESQAFTDTMPERRVFVSDEVAEDNNLIIKEKDFEPGVDDEPVPEKPGRRRSKKKPKGAENGPIPSTSSPDGSSVLEKAAPAKPSKRQASLIIPSIVLSFPFSIIHLLSAVRTAMILPPDEPAFDPTCFGGESGVRETLNDSATFMMSPEIHYFEPNGQPLQCDSILDVKDSEEEKKGGLSPVPFLEIVRRVKDNPGDSRILEMQEPLQGLVRGVLKVLSSKTTPPGIKGWKPFVLYDKENRAWSWIGTLPPPAAAPFTHDTKEIQISAEAWGVSEKIVIKIQELYANWLKQAQEMLQQRVQLALPPPPSMLVPVDEKERFRELRAQKSLVTINPSSEEMKVYYHREEALRYSVPDRAFTYTTADGCKSVVAPLRRIGGKPNSKVRDHFMLKSDRPPHVTILCLVRDAAARLPGSIGTRADVCALIRDSQYIVEDVSDAQLNQVVSGALDRLHYERDPCIRFDGDRKLWVYLHTDRDEEDFEDDGTSSTKRWKKTKKEGVEIENPDFSLVQDYGYSGGDDQDPCGMGLDFSSPSCFGGPGDLSVYSSSRPELVFNHQSGSLISPHLLGSGFPGQVREDGMLPFIDLPPSIQPPCVNMQQSHPMGWEVLGNHWDHERHFHPHDHIIHEEYSAGTTQTVLHNEAGTVIERVLQ